MHARGCFGASQGQWGALILLKPLFGDLASCYTLGTATTAPSSAKSGPLAKDAPQVPRRACHVTSEQVAFQMEGARYARPGNSIERRRVYQHLL